MAKRSRLVRQHLERISARVLEKYQKVVRECVKGKSGIYALYRRDKLYYVGLASNLRRRLRKHLRDRHSGAWDKFSVYLTSGDRHLRELESLVLRITDPSGNVVGGKLPRSQDLRPRLRRDMTALLKKEIEGLLGTTRRTNRKRKKKRRRRRPKKPAVGREPALASCTGKNGLAVTPGAWAMLKASYKGKKLKAFVRRDGMIRYDGERFATPSGAARAVCKKRHNGWRFWKYKTAAGEWVPLNELRKTSKRQRS